MKDDARGTDDPDIVAMREAYEEDTNGWAEIRKEAKKDMRFVAGNPWDADDEKQRKNRPTVAPEEMGQYFNQVINQLRSNPRGMKFAPTGNGATDEGARFYQNKAREIEYRSHAKIAYITAAENAIQRGYGFVRVNTRYANPRSANQEIWIEDFPNPDMVMPDCNSKRPDSSDMTRCFVYQWMLQRDLKKQHPKAKITNFGDWQSHFPQWVQANKVLLAEYWTIKTRPRRLLLVQPPSPQGPPRQIAPQPMAAPRPIQLFDDELAKMAPGAKVIRELRTVDYPDVWMYLTNGLEMLHEQKWPGKYIPIVSCYGKVLWKEGDGGLERVLMSMTRFGRDPWKSYCFACSQELEVLGMVPKSPVVAYPGQMAGFEKDWQEAAHVPKAFLYAHAVTPASGSQVLPLPQRMEYAASQYLQAIEIVKEGYRRAIQSAMGSNFLPTQAQRRNEKSGVALDKMEKAAATGTFHFVDHYDDMIRQVAVISEDLIPHVYDFEGETGVMDAEEKAHNVPINNPSVKDAIDTKGDYLVTVSTGPSSDSEREAADDFTDTLVGNIATVAQISGPKAAAAVLAQSIRMRNLGAKGDKLAELISPEDDGQEQQPLPPEVQQKLQEGEQAKQMLQQAAQELKTEQAKQQATIQKAQLDAQAGVEKAHIDAEKDITIARERNAATIRVAEINAQVKGLTTLQQTDAESIALENKHAHEAVQSELDREQEKDMAQMGQEHALEQGAQSHQGAMAQQAAKPTNGATA